MYNSYFNIDKLHIGFFFFRKKISTKSFIMGFDNTHTVMLRSHNYILLYFTVGFFLPSTFFFFLNKFICVIVKIIL